MKTFCQSLNLKDWNCTVSVSEVSERTYETGSYRKKSTRTVNQSVERLSLYTRPYEHTYTLTSYTFSQK